MKTLLTILALALVPSTTLAVTLVFPQDQSRYRQFFDQAAISPSTIQRSQPDIWDRTHFRTTWANRRLHPYPRTRWGSCRTANGVFKCR